MSGPWQSFIEERFPGNQALFSNEQACLIIQDTTAHLFFIGTQSAGAIGKAQGEALDAAISAIDSASIQSLRFYVNSSGASFNEPMEGLFHLNNLLEKLWDLKTQGIRISFLCDGWLYGGMALLASTVADEIQLTTTAQLGLLGHRATGIAQTTEIIPRANVYPSHLQLKRIASLGR